MSKNARISKSNFIRSVQCQKSLYLQRFHYAQRDRISKEQQAIFQRGTDMGVQAQQLFPGGIDASPASHLRINQSIRMTRLLIGSGYQTIYEAAFAHDDCVCMVDIMQWNDGVSENGEKVNPGWDAYEVKSSSYISNTHLLDAAFQYQILKGLDLQLRDFHLVTVNYQAMESQAASIQDIFVIETVTEKLEELNPYVIDKTTEAKATLKGGEIPDIRMGEHCEKPYRCHFRGFCGRLES